MAVSTEECIELLQKIYHKRVMVVPSDPVSPFVRIEWEHPLKKAVREIREREGVDECPR